MKSRKSNLIQIGILAVLGLAVILSLLIPQLFREIGRASCRERV